MARIPRIGQLRHTITVEDNGASEDSGGWVQSDSWSAVGPATQWAAIVQLSANSPFAAAQQRPFALFDITIRDDGSAYSATNRITATLHSTARTFKVLGIQRLPAEKPRWVQFTCEELAAQ